MKILKFRAMLMALLATSALAACSSGSTGMLPTNPQTQSVPQTPNRAIGSAPSGMGMHATVHTPNGSNLVVGMNPATGQNPTGPIGRAHTDAVSAPSNNPCPAGYSAGGSAEVILNNREVGTVQCYPDLGGSGGTSGTGGCTSNVECGQPCYEGGSGCSYNPRVATAAPEKGKGCDNSPAVLGYSNLPGGTKGWATTVVNIFGLQDGPLDEYGWIYQTANQDLFFQRNPAAAQSSIDWLTGFFDKLPFVQGIADYLISATTSPYQITGTQANTIESSLQQSGYKVHPCFTGPLPYTPLVD